MELSGAWSAAPADEALRRRYPQPDFDDRDWDEIDVPGHWQSVERFADHDGPLLYRHRFEADPADDDRRSWLVFEGIFYAADVWLDGDYVGDTEGYFHPHEFDVTEHLRGGRQHLLAAEVSCDRPRDLTAKRLLTGVFQHWDCLDPDDNPGGIWRPVHLVETGSVRISRMRVLCAEATAERAVVDLRAVLDSTEAGGVQLRTTITPAAGTRTTATRTAGARTAGTSTTGEKVEHHRDVTVAAGENRIEWRVAVDAPDLWWPHTLGAQPLYDVEVTVTAPGSAATSDRRTTRTGLRQVAMDDWVLSVNGERLFLKGANQGPLSPRLAEVDDAVVDDLVARALDANLDFLRVHAHIANPRLYEAADRAGLLLWQDMPLQWGYARSVRAQAARQAREAVDLLGQHPSVFLWCGHNEPMALDLQPGKEVDVVRTGLRAAAMQQLPTWNKSVIDRRIKRALTKSDPTRPVVAHSGMWPGLVAAGTDSHLYFGWYWGDAHDFPSFCAAWPRQARFVSEFGAQAVPDDAAFMSPERWPDLDWEHLGRHHVMQRQFFAAHGLDPATFDSFDDWRTATQSHQAELIRIHVETLRRLKYRPTGGFALFSFADAHPAVSWSVLDHAGNPKAGFEALRAACAPVVVVAGPLDIAYQPGATLATAVHIVNDTRTEQAGVVSAEVHLPDGTARSWRWSGEADPDACALVGELSASVGSQPGPLSLAIELVGHDGTTVSQATYTSAVFPS